MPHRIRPISANDDAAVAQLIVATLTEFGAVGPGYASGDAETHAMYAFYGTTDDDLAPKAYWVIEDVARGEIRGGGGFSRLKGTTPEDSICELQKLYFHPDLRGQGWGRKLISECIQAACQAGYRQMYLESLPQMQAAVGLYEKLGFVHLPQPLGNTGHSQNCSIRMGLWLPQPVLNYA